jgi:hypothetical protein
MEVGVVQSKHRISTIHVYYVQKYVTRRLSVQVISLRLFVRA